jgi:hypothetical protein
MFENKKTDQETSSSNDKYVKRWHVCNLKNRTFE